MIAASPAPMIAAAILRARRKIASHFFVHHALSAEDAVAYVPERRIVRHQFARMQRKGIVREAGSGRYWLDTAALDADTARRRRLLVPVAIVLILIVAAIPLFFYRG